MRAQEEKIDAEALQALPPRSGHRRRPARVAGRLIDGLLAIHQVARRTGTALDREAARAPSRRVVVLGVYGQDGGSSMSAALQRLRSSRHDVGVTLGALGAASPELSAVTALERMTAGRQANLNRLASLADVEHSDWVLLLDDDVALGERFLDRLLVLAERFHLQLGQPALSHSSHTAWPVTRRRPSLLRLTNFVEMGPVVLMRRSAFTELSPFPEQGMGWGTCLHWAAVAKRRGWRLGIADAVPARHDRRPPAMSYDSGEAQAAALELLREREHIDWHQAGQVLARYGRP